MIHLASFLLWFALICAIYGMIAGGVALATRSPRWLNSATRALQALASLLTLAMLLLLLLLLLRDFRVEYVAAYTSLNLPPMYVLSALWAGQEGSLLFWGWSMALCGALFARSARCEAIKARFGLRHVPRLLRSFPVYSVEIAVTVMALAAVSAGFLLLLVTHSHPFRLLPEPPGDGSGLNPLLQTPYMVVHPPLLFIGYAGFVVPFAMAFGALWAGTISAGWLKLMRRWTLFSWYFLGIGILLGARWAYLELGWGGYWGWDPVENSSLIPWLTATALLHTLMLQQRNGSLPRWNLLLSITNFLLCLFATFITRSGVLQSVHAYAESSVGVYFLLLLALAGAAVIALFLLRWRQFQPPATHTPFFSKEYGVQLTGQLLLGFAFAVFYGTIYPMLVELISGKTIVISADFFNRVSVPLGLVIFAVIGACQLLPWKQASWDMLRGRVIAACVAAGAVAVVLALLGVRAWPVLITSALAALVGVTIAQQRTACTRPFALFHLGTAIVFVGIAVSSAYKIEQHATLKAGESVALGAYRFEFAELLPRQASGYGVVSARIVVYKDDKIAATLWPEKRMYSESQVTTEIGLKSSLLRDMYVILDGWDDEAATLTFIVYPAILWIWFGGFAMCSAGILWKCFAP